MKAIFIPLFFLLLFGCNQPKITEEPLSTPVVRTSPRQVTTGPLETRSITHNISCTGRVEVPPTDLISVHSRVTGQVSGLKYLPGDYISKGTLLLRVSNPELLDKQRSLLETKAKLSTAQRALYRQNTLDAGEATTQANLEAAEGEVALLEASYRGLKEELLAYGIQVKALEEDDTFQSSVGVYATGSGFVHAVTTNQGQMVSPADELLLIAGTKHLHLELNVPAKEVAAVRKGQTVRFLLPFNELKGIATVEKINPMVDATTSMLNVHCHFEGELPEGLVPGLFLNATILTGERSLRGLPLDAVVKEGATWFGFKVVNGVYEKTVLSQAEVLDDFVTFQAAGTGDWVTSGAYYLDSGEE